MHSDGEMMKADCAPHAMPSRPFGISPERSLLWAGALARRLMRLRLGGGRLLCLRILQRFDLLLGVIFHRSLA